MSHLHFTATEIYKDRVIQLGENSSNVFNFGAPGIDNINRLRLLTYKELDKEVDFKARTQISLGYLSSSYIRPKRIYYSY